MTTPAYEIRTGLRPGDLGQVARLHGLIYAAEYGFDASFEPYVAAPLSEFALAGQKRQAIWLVDCGGEVQGSVAMVDAGDDMAQLRWLILGPGLRGLGLGRELVGRALGFARAHDYRSIFLWTLDILPAATGLYKSFGFLRTETKPGRRWGRELVEERFDLAL